MVLSAKVWEREWRKLYHSLRWNDGLPQARALREAHRLMERRYGPRPQKPGGFQAAVLRIVGGIVMPESVKKFVNRWGVLISVFYLAAVTILRTLSERGCEACGTVAGFVQTAFGLLALTPDPALGPEIAAIVAGGFAVYGGTRKVISLAKKGRAGAA